MINRAKEIQNFIDSFSPSGLKQEKAEKDGICMLCSGIVGEFKDDLSQQEYGISGMCQSCQDKVFGRIKSKELKL